MEEFGSGDQNNSNKNLKITLWLRKTRNSSEKYHYRLHTLTKTLQETSNAQYTPLATDHVRLVRTPPQHAQYIPNPSSVGGETGSEKKTVNKEKNMKYLV